MTSSYPSERRRKKRAAFSKLIRVHEIHESQSGNIFEMSQHRFYAQSVNLSEHGICLILPEEAPILKVLKLELPVSESESANIYGRVIWNGKRQMGVRFSFLDAKNKKLIQRCLEYLS
jgi:hypothetical protein